MPEGDTIFRAARTLHLALAGKVVTRFETVLPKLGRVDADAPIAGRVVEEVSARGKHQLIRFSAAPAGAGRKTDATPEAAGADAAGPLVLRTHMRMNGSWHLYRVGERWQRPRAAMRVSIETADVVAVGFDVPVAELLDARALARHDELRRLGPDLLAPEFDQAEAARRARGRGADPVADVLLDQRVLAGVGNVFKSEVLFVAGVSPFRSVASLSDAELDLVLRVSRKLLCANVGPGAGEGLAAYQGSRRTTGAANPAVKLWVYGRGGEPCRRCATAIAFAKHGPDARVTYWCPRCQPGPAP